MRKLNIQKALIIGATGQVGGKTIDALLAYREKVEIIAAVRSADKAKQFDQAGIATVILDLDNEDTHAHALQGIDTLFLLTSYTVDMLRQSKVILDEAKKAGVKHVVHLGACGRDDTKVAHWAWHQLIERYIEWHGFSFTHLRPEAFMQNLLSFGGNKVIVNGVVHAFVADARQSWVDVDDVALVAATVIAFPEKHAGQTYRLGYDARTYAEIVALMTAIVGKPFIYEPQSPEVFLKTMIEAGAEMAYMSCVYEHWKLYANYSIPGADDTFDNFYSITGRQATSWPDFIEKHKGSLL